MAFDFIQKKFDKYVSETATRVFDSACASLMVQRLVSPLVVSTSTIMISEPHILSAVEAKVKDLFAHAGMHAEILTKTEGMSVEFKMNVFDSQEVIENDHVKDFYWSRQPGKFVNKLTGAIIDLDRFGKVGPAFTGTVREWYECLVETCIDANNHIHEKSGTPAEIIRCGADILTILECSVLYRPTFSLNGDPSPYEGTLANRFKVIKDASMPRGVLEISQVKDNKKTFCMVNVMDMNII